MALRLAVLFVLAWAASAAAQDATRTMLARLRLTTDPKVPVGCTTLGTVSDSSLKDLRRKIARLGGDTALLSFPPEDLERIHAVAFRCPPAAAAPPGIPPPPPGPPPPPPPGALPPPPPR